MHTVKVYYGVRIDLDDLHNQYFCVGLKRGWGCCCDNETKYDDYEIPWPIKKPITVQRASSYLYTCWDDNTFDHGNGSVVIGVFIMELCGENAAQTIPEVKPEVVALMDTFTSTHSLPKPALVLQVGDFF